MTQYNRYVHGFAPSAMSSIRRDARFTSFWSFCASIAQCISRDFTTATVADRYTTNSYLIGINICGGKHEIYTVTSWKQAN